jgi:hypothetical protein
MKYGAAKLSPELCLFKLTIHYNVTISGHTWHLLIMSRPPVGMLLEYSMKIQNVRTLHIQQVIKHVKIYPLLIISLLTNTVLQYYMFVFNVLRYITVAIRFTQMQELTTYVIC